MIKGKMTLSLIAIISLIGIIGFFVYQLYIPKTGQVYGIKDTIIGEASIYMSTSCGCCANYANYLERQEIPVNRVYVNDVSSIKNQYRIPLNMQSCHTTVIGGYFVEGHVPMEAIVKLLQEQPDIAGIALPGMPSGSPGMTGPKYGSFKIYTIGQDGETSLFMSV